MTAHDEQQAQMLAQTIADELFTNGFGETAVRLKMVGANGHDLGGWCRNAVVQRIAAALSASPETGYAVLTEAQAVKLFSAAFAMGHAIIPGMPVVEDIVRQCHSDIADVIMEVEMPDIAGAVIRQGQLPPAPSEET